MGSSESYTIIHASIWISPRMKIINRHVSMHFSELLNRIIPKQTRIRAGGTTAWIDGIASRPGMHERMRPPCLPPLREPDRASLPLPALRFVTWNAFSYYKCMFLRLTEHQCNMQADYCGWLNARTFCRGDEYRSYNINLKTLNQQIWVCYSFSLQSIIFIVKFIIQHR